MRPAALGIVALLVVGALAGCLGEDETSPSRSSPTTSPSPTPTGSGLVAAFTLLPEAPTVGVLVAFQDASRDAQSPLASWAWDFGDGTASTQRNPNHTYEKADLYTVTLRVRNEAGKEATARRLLSVPLGAGSGNATTSEFLKFGAPKTVQDSQGGEPSLAVDKDARIYVAPVGRLYRSTDKGSNFAEKTPPGVLSGDSHVVVDPDNRVWYSDLGGVTVPGLGSATVFSSTDHGDSWAGNVAATDSVYTDRQWLAAPGGGVAYLLFRQCVAPVPPASCVSAGATGVITKTTDGGLTWAPLARLFEWTSFPFVDAKNDRLYVVQAIGTSVVVDVSDDGGSSWTSRTAATRTTSTANLFVTGAADAAGNVYVAWVDKDSEQYDVWMAVSKDHGTTWTKPIRASAGVGTNVMPWIAAAGTGKVVLAWYGTSTVGSPETIATDTKWYVYTGVTTDALAANVTFAAARATGVIHEGRVCMGGAGCDDPVAGSQVDRDLLDFMMVALLPDGRAVLSYAEDGATSNAKTQFALQSAGPLSR